MTPAYLTIAAVAALAAAGKLKKRGSRSSHTVVTKQDKARLLHQRAIDVLDSGICGEDIEWYHVTIQDHLSQILENGLKNLGGNNFDMFAEYSQGRLFVSASLENARIWARLLKSRGLKPVILEIREDLEPHVFYDENGSQEVECSFFITHNIPASKLRIVSK